MAIRSKTFCESYHEDIKLLDTIWSRCWMGLFIIGLLFLPYFSDSYILYMVNLSCIAVVAAVGLNILTGLTGQISLGHAAFLAIGAYTAALLGEGLGMPFWVTLPAGGLVSAAAGILVGVPCLRLKGLYLAMATMSFGVMTEYLLMNWGSLTGGERGMYMPEVTVLGHILDTDESMYYFLLCIVALMIIAAKNIVRTRVGRAFVAVRDRDIAAEAMGVNLTGYKVMAFAVSSFYAGVAGGMYAYVMGYIHPDHFTLMSSVEYMAMIVIGGLGSILGSIFGAVFIVVVPEGIKLLAQGVESIIPAMQGSYDDEWNIAVFGLLIMLFLIFEPGGLNAIWQRIKTGFKNWPFTY